MMALGALAGLHAALYGAYKDAPHESFLPRRFARELIIAIAVGAALPFFDPAGRQSPFIIYLSIFALSRIITEFWKLFLRVEPQEGFRIPTQIHCVRGVVRNPVVRLLLGSGFLGAIYGCYGLFTLLPDSLPWSLVGLIVGFGIGLAEAIGGAYKDGAIEGFYVHKFLKSPTFGVLGGVIAAGHTESLAFVLLAAMGTMRMLLELLFKILRPDYVPGKFRSMTAQFPAWLTWRTHFLPLYVATWMLYLVLLSHPQW
jgi:hypothetical protein